jgi:hypothetical protein
MYSNQEYTNIVSHKDKVNGINNHAWQYQKDNTKTKFQEFACSSKLHVINKHCKCS